MGERETPGEDQMVEVFHQTRKLMRAALVGQLQPLQLQRAMLRIWTPFLHNMYESDMLCDDLEPRTDTRWWQWIMYARDVHSADSKIPPPFETEEFVDPQYRRVRERLAEERKKAANKLMPGTHRMARDIPPARPGSGPADDSRGGTAHQAAARGRRPEQGPAQPPNQEK